MRRYATGLVCLLAASTLTWGLACAPAPRTPRPVPPGQPHLTVLTYNVNFGIPGEPGVVETIRGAAADLVLLQETTPAWEAELRAALRANYPWMEFHHEPGAGGLGVLARRPFEVKEYLPAPSGWFPAARVVARTALGPVQVLNVHLRPPFAGGEGYVSGYLKSRDTRRAEIAAFHARLDPRLPTLVVGDFNEDEGGRAVRFLAERGLRSVLPDFQPRGRTWRWHTSLGTLRARLDHIACDARLEPLAARIVVGGESDHLAVLATFVRAR
jgi:endonuclease/exonuclease/phosphatase (EEP) superfamily protein YafD